MCCLKVLSDLKIFDHVSKHCIRKKTYKMRLYLVFYLPASKCKGKTLVHRSYRKANMIQFKTYISFERLLFFYELQNKINICFWKNYCLK